jgi:hypothetical protein
MTITALGVSGSSGGGGSLSLPTSNVVVAPGQVYELSRWVGYTLRHLSFSVWLTGYYPTGAIAITDRLPNSLHPRDSDPQALWKVLLGADFFRATGIATFDFAPGLIWVGPGEKLYVVVYDLVSSVSAAANTGRWALNMLWEPYSR